MNNDSDVSIITRAWDVRIRVCIFRPLKRGARAAVAAELGGNFFDGLYARLPEDNVEEKPVPHVVVPVLVENEIAERVVNVFSRIEFVLLHHMRVRADDHLRPGVYKTMG